MYGESLSSTTAPEEPGFGGVKVVALGGLGFDGESRRVELCDARGLCRGAACRRREASSRRKSHSGSRRHHRNQPINGEAPVPHGDGAGEEKAWKRPSHCQSWRVSYRMPARVAGLLSQLIGSPSEVTGMRYLFGLELSSESDILHSGYLMCDESRKGTTSVITWSRMRVYRERAGGDASGSSCRLGVCLYYEC